MEEVPIVWIEEVEFNKFKLRFPDGEIFIWTWTTQNESFKKEERIPIKTIAFLIRGALLYWGKEMGFEFREDGEKDLILLDNKKKLSI